MAAPHGVSIAFDDPALEPDPTWTRLDDQTAFPGLSVQEWSIDRGRSTEFDRMETGTATVKIIDRDGTLDPTNAGGPLFGLLDPMKQAAIALEDPVSHDWSTLFRGFVSEWLYEMDVTETFSRVTIELTDAFDLLSAIEMKPGIHGMTGAPADMAQGDVWFEGKPDIDTHVDDRISEALAKAGWPSVLQEIFTGNVFVRFKVYPRGDQLLTVIQDAADAEFPTVATFYVAKDGTVTFHGRFARFNPGGSGYGIQTWKVGDEAAYLADSDTAVISPPLQFRRSKLDIYNTALVTWDGMSQTDDLVADLVVKDDTSIGLYGYRGWTADNLITYEGHDPDDIPTDAATETKRFSQYIVDQYKAPFTRVPTLTFRPQNPFTARGGKVWLLLRNIELNDIVSLKTTHVGGGGFDENLYVEGLHYEAQPMTGTHPEITLNVDVSPASLFPEGYFGTDPEDA